MKNTLRYMMLAAMVVAASTACTKDSAESPADLPGKIMKVTVDGDLVVNNAASRTYYDEASQTMYWNNTGEEMKVLQIVGGALNPVTPPTTTDYVLSSDLATFQVAFPVVSPGPFTYTALYPAVNHITNDNDDPLQFKVQLPAAQTPGTTSFDPNADLMISRPITRADQPTELQFQLWRAAAIGKMTLNGITTGESISRVEITASKNIAGRCYADMTTGNITTWGYTGQGIKTITLDMQGATASGTDAIWFTSLPCELGDGDTFTVTVTTDVATYEKSLDLSAAKSLNFISGDISKFSVSGMTRTLNVTDEYNLVTNAADLAVGDMVIFASAANGAAKAMSNQTANNRATTDVTISGSTISTLTPAIRIFEVGAGTISGTFSFYDDDATDNGYLYAASNSSNYLRTQGTLSANSSWSVSITNNVLLAVAQGTYTRNTLQYNSGSDLFACYGGASQSSVYIFSKVAAPKTPLDAPTGLTASAAGNVVTVSWSAVTGAADYTVSCGASSKDVVGTSTTFDMAYDMNYDVSVVANPTDTDNYKSSAATTTTVTTDLNPNPVIEFDLTTTQIANPVSGVNNITGVDAFVYNSAVSPKFCLVYGKGSAAAVPYFYSSGSSNTQLNEGNTLVIEGMTMTSIEFTGTSTEFDYLAADVGTYDAFVWTGNSNRVTFTSTGGFMRLTKIVITYDDTSTAVFTPAIAEVEPAALNFPAEGSATGETIQVTVMNQGTNTISASGLSGTLHSSVSGTTVTVTADENTGAAVDQDLTISLTNGNSVIVPVTQLAVGETDPVWEEVTDYSTISTGKYIYIAVNGGTNYYMKNSTVTAAGGVVPGTTATLPTAIGFTAAADMVLDFTGTQAAGFTIGNGTDYLGATSTNNGVTMKPINSATLWIVETNSTCGFVFKQTTPVANRFLGLYQTTNYRTYSPIHDNITASAYKLYRQTN